MYKQKLQPYKETTKREDWPNTDLSARKFAEASGVKYPLYISSTTYRTNLYENYFISPRSLNVMWLLLQNSPLRQGQSLRSAGSTINTTVSFRFLALIYNLYNM